MDEVIKTIKEMEISLYRYREDGTISDIEVSIYSGFLHTLKILCEKESDERIRIFFNYFQDIAERVSVQEDYFVDLEWIDKLMEEDEIRDKLRRHRAYSTVLSCLLEITKDSSKIRYGKLAFEFDRFIDISKLDLRLSLKKGGK